MAYRDMHEFLDKLDELGELQRVHVEVEPQLEIAEIEDENEVCYKGVGADLVLAKMEQANNDVNIVALDACRDNPFTRSFRNT